MASTVLDRSNARLDVGQRLLEHATVSRAARTLQVGKHPGPGKLERVELLLPFRVSRRDRRRVVDGAPRCRRLLLILHGLAFPPSGHDHLSY